MAASPHYLNVDPQIARNLQGKRGDKVDQALHHLWNCSLQGRPDLIQTLHHQPAVQGVKAGQKLGGVLDFHIPGAKRFGREIPQVERDAYLAPRTDRRRQHVAILRVVLQTAFDRLQLLNFSL